MTDPTTFGSTNQANDLQKEKTSDVNAAFDDIALACFEEYPKPPLTQTPTSSTVQPVKHEHPYKSKKNKYKGKK
jgi:hypothetical protein